MKKLPLKIVGIRSVDMFLNILLFLIGVLAIAYLFGVIYGLIECAIISRS
jgi:uncharacterized membrane protein YqaE (UPF0057 family)